MNIPCLDCGAPLVVRPHRTIVTCRCGLDYSVELIEQRDEAEWERVHTERDFTRDGKVLILTSRSLIR